MREERGCVCVCVFLHEDLHAGRLKRVYTPLYRVLTAIRCVINKLRACEFN